MHHQLAKTIFLAATIPALTVSTIPMTQVLASQETQTISTTEDTTQSSASGRITEITDTSMTLSVMGKPGEAPQNNGSDSSTKQQPPEKPSESSEQTTQPTGQPAQVATQSALTIGQPTDNNGQGNTNQMPSEETITITLASTTVFTKQEDSGTDATIQLSDLAVGDHVNVTYDSETMVAATVAVMSMGDAPSQAPGGNGGGTPNTESSVTLTGKYTLDGKTATVANKTYSSTTADQNSVLATNSAKLTLNKCTLKKTGDSTNVDNSNFSGLNSILCANLGSTVVIKNSTLTSSSEGSNAIFSTGENSVVKVSNVKINTTGNSSRGLDATYGGTIIASNVDITTTGAHCAPLATDRGEGTVTLTKGTLSAAGDGSPCIYSTGNITVKNVKGVATGSQAAVIEGKNSITLVNSRLTGAGLNGIMLYQSTSGDASVGTSVLTAKNSAIKTTSTGPMFYVTNTDAKVVLNNTKLIFSSGILVNAAGNSTNNWGTPGSNGGNLTLRAVNQTLKGAVQCDSISSVMLRLGNKSTYTGCLDNENTGDVSIVLAKNATWTLTKDSYVSSITDTDTTLSNIQSAGYSIYYDATNEANAWLNGETKDLVGGGKLTPMN